MSDTDSFLFSCTIPENKTMEEILKENEKHFDFSNLSRDGKYGRALFTMDHKNDLNRYFFVGFFRDKLIFHNMIISGSNWNQKMQEL